MVRWRGGAGGWGGEMAGWWGGEIAGWLGGGVGVVWWCQSIGWGDEGMVGWGWRLE